MIIFKGFKFGMLLQLAVGPMCLMVFNTSASLGFFKGLVLVFAIALVDAIYITLSGFGVAAILKKKQVETAVKIFGGVVLVIFGLNIMLSVFNISLLPDISLFPKGTSQNLFLQGLLLTASNPLTIIFWSGVFSAQVAENKLNDRQLRLFEIGCVLSTIFFLSLVAALGNIFSGFIPLNIIKMLNILVGIVLIGFGLKILLNKQKETSWNHRLIRTSLCSR